MLQHHDELLFTILVDETYELWFEELMHDLDAVVAKLRRLRDQIRNRGTKSTKLPDCCDAVRRLRESWVEQFTILETMLPTHFLVRFRGKLEPASGFERHFWSFSFCVN